MPVLDAPRPDAPAPDATDVGAEEAARVRLGVRPDTPAHVLVQLARDPAVTVRAAVAMNHGATPATDLVLATDADERVRALLAQRISRLLPGLPVAGRNQAHDHVIGVLTALAQDAAIRVRAAIADAVKAMPDAPRALILCLAQDPAPPVSDPVIRLSPLLTDADLVALLAAPPHPLAPHAVASRAGLSATVADAVAARADDGAVRALLLNPSATIRETTLDALAAQAAGHAEWHAPLVRRPALGARAAHALCEIVALQLVTELVQRTDLSPALTAELRARVAVRLSRPAAPGDSDTLTAARRLYAAGRLDEAALLDAARAGQARQVAALLAVASGVPLAAVDRAAALRSAKGLVALVWRAGFTMRAGLVTQMILASLGSDRALLPRPDGEFPLRPDEMEWQLEVLGHPGA